MSHSCYCSEITLKHTPAMYHSCYCSEITLKHACVMSDISKINELQLHRVTYQATRRVIGVYKSSCCCGQPLTAYSYSEMSRLTHLTTPIHVARRLPFSISNHFPSTNLLCRPMPIPSCSSCIRNTF